MEKLDNKNYILMSIIIIEYILLFMSWVMNIFNIIYK